MKNPGHFWVEINSIAMKTMLRTYMESDWA
jgi:hypothetical protein